MRLYIRQRIFSWTDSYDVYDHTGEARYEVRTEIFTLGHQIHVYEKSSGREVGSIHQKLFTLMPQFDIVIAGKQQGTVRKSFSLFKPYYQLDYRGWEVEGNFLGWDYRVTQNGREIMSISKEVFRLSDCYELSFANEADEMPGLLLVLAIDAANCDNN